MAVSKLKFILFTFVIILSGFSLMAQPKVSLDRKTVDHGTVVAWNNPPAIFNIKNIGNKDLVFLPVMPEVDVMVIYPKDKIPPGGTNEIQVIYYTENTGSFSRKVEVYTNADGEPLKLTVKGNIESLHPEASIECPTVGGEQSEQALMFMIYGVVVDEATQLPIQNAKVQITQTHQNNHIMQTNKMGKFQEMLRIGPYQVIVTADGYKTLSEGMYLTKSTGQLFIELVKDEPLIIAMTPQTESQPEPQEQKQPQEPVYEEPQEEQDLPVAFNEPEEKDEPYYQPQPQEDKKQPKPQKEEKKETKKTSEKNEGDPVSTGKQEKDEPKSKQEPVYPDKQEDEPVVVVYTPNDSKKQPPTQPKQPTAPPPQPDPIHTQTQDPYERGDYPYQNKNDVPSTPDPVYKQPDYEVTQKDDDDPSSTAPPITTKPKADDEWTKEDEWDDIDTWDNPPTNTDQSGTYTSSDDDDWGEVPEIGMNEQDQNPTPTPQPTQEDWDDIPTISGGQDDDQPVTMNDDPFGDDWGDDPEPEPTSTETQSRDDGTILVSYDPEEDMEQMPPAPLPDPDPLPLSKYNPNNVVFLIDVSISMDKPNKLPLMKQSMKQLVDVLRDVDRIGVITYSTEPTVVLNSIALDSKDSINSIIDGLNSYGLTLGVKGITAAYDILEENFIPGGNNQLIIATDGLFNGKDFSESDLYKMARDKQKKGMILSVVGFGDDQDAIKMMGKMADNGEGRFHHIQTESDANNLLIEEIKFHSSRTQQ